MDEDKQLAKDLAIAYAKVKLQHAISNGSIKSDFAPPEIDEMEYLLDEFRSAFDYYYLSCGVHLDYDVDDED